MTGYMRVKICGWDTKRAYSDPGAGTVAIYINITVTCRSRSWQHFTLLKEEINRF